MYSTLRSGTFDTVSQAAIAPGNNVLVYGKYRERGYTVAPLTSRIGNFFSERVSASEAFELAGLNWTAEKLPAYFPDLNGTPRIAPGYCSIRRSDNGDLLGLHSSSYTPVQHQGLINLLDYLREDIEIESVLSIRQGKKLFVSAALKLEDEIVPGDRIRRYLHAFNSHDGSSSFGISFSDRRLACANELGYFTGRAMTTAVANGTGLRARHTTNVNKFIENLPSLIDIQRKAFHKRIWHLQDMANVRLTTELTRRILEATYRDSLSRPVQERNGSTRPRVLEDLKHLPTIMSHLTGSTGYAIATSPTAGTVYGLFNAITQYETHDAGRGSDPLDRTRARLESLWGGTSSTRIDHAFEACLTTV